MEVYNKFIDFIRNYETKLVLPNGEEIPYQLDYITPSGKIAYLRGGNLTFNGFSCNKISDIGVYYTYLSKLYYDAFFDLKRETDKFLVNNNMSGLDIFLDLKGDDIRTAERIIENEDNALNWNLDRYISLKTEAERTVDTEYVGILDNMIEFVEVVQMYFNNVIGDSFDYQYFSTYDIPFEDEIESERQYVRLRIEKIQRNMYSNAFWRFNQLCFLYNPNSETTTLKRPSTNDNTPKNFIDYIQHPNKNAMLSRLHELLDNKKGKIVAITIIAMEKLGFIGGYESRSTLYKTMRIEFGDIGTDAGLNDFFTNRHKIAQTDFEQYTTILSMIK